MIKKPVDIARQNELVTQYKKLHASRPYGTGPKGAVLLRFLKTECEKFKDITSVIDYGAGQSYVAWALFPHPGISKQAYDPAVPWRAVKPQWKADVVLCLNCLEHIPAENVDHVLSDIFSTRCKHALFLIGMKKASTKLSNGENAHCTLRSSNWWLNRIEQYSRNPVRDITPKDPRITREGAYNYFAT